VGASQVFVVRILFLKEVLIVSSTPLNPSLHAALERCFTEVTIASPGEQRSVVHRPRWGTTGKATLQAVQAHAGEAYRVSCRFCDDTRSRLYINHQYGVRDPVTGQDNQHLATCFNEDCLSDPKNRSLLFNLVFAHSQHSRRLTQQIMPGPAPRIAVAVRANPVVTALPADAVAIDRLPQGHRARSYLEQRDFEANELSTHWGVCYCEPSQEPYSNRLLIPMRTLAMTFTAGHVVQEIGWQARAVLPNHDPKYLNSTGLRKSELLYGLPEAVSSEGPVVLVEGVTDVWRLASNAVALLGKTMSARQAELLGRHLSGRPIVVLLDSDAAQDADRIRIQVRQMRQTRQDHSLIRVGTLPPGRSDVGECTHDEAWAAVEAALR